MNLICLLFHTLKITFTSIFKCFSLKLRDLGVQIMLLSTVVLVVFIVSSSELAIFHVSSDYSWCPKYFSSTMTFTLVEAISLVLRSFNLPLLDNLIDFRVSFLVVVVGESVFQNLPNQVSISAHRVSILDNLVIKINETSFNIEQITMLGVMVSLELIFLSFSSVKLISFILSCLFSFSLFPL